MADSPAAATKTPATKRTVIEVIVLAFSKSELKDVVGTDALRTVLEGRYMDMVRTPGTVNLQPLWDLLMGQEGVVAEKAIPPMCRIKQWESRLMLTIELPKELTALGQIQRDRVAQQCKVAEDELNKLFLPTTPVQKAEAQQSQKVIEKKRELRMTAGVLFGVVAFLALTVGGALYFTFGGGPESIDPKKLSTELPIKEVRRSADLLGVVLADKSAWVGKSADDRRRVVAETLDHGRALGAQRIVVMDEKGAPLAQGSLGDDGKPVVTLQ